MISANQARTSYGYVSGGVVQSAYSTSPSPTRGLPGFDPSTSQRQWDESDFAAGSVLGARWWTWVLPDITQMHPGRLSQEWPKNLLTGQTGMAWPDGAWEASCNQFPDEHKDICPVLECGCGFWAYWKVQGKIPPAAFGLGKNLFRMPVAGIIEGSGRTLMGDMGYRSQTAKIVALHIPSPSPANFVATFNRLYTTNSHSFYDDSGRFVFTSWDEDIMKKMEEFRDAWMGIFEVRLAEMYPSARIFSNLDAMISVYPPEAAAGS